MLPGEGTTMRAPCWGTGRDLKRELELERMCRALAFGNEEATSDLCRVQTGEQGTKPKLRGGRGLISGIRGMETEVGGGRNCPEAWLRRRGNNRWPPDGKVLSLSVKGG